MVIDMITTIVPILIISWVLFLLLKKTIKTYLLSGIILASSFIMIWLIVGWKINRELDTKTYLVEYKTVIGKITNKETGKKEELTSIVKASTILKNNSKIVGETIKIKELDKIKIGTNVWLFDTDNNGSLKYISNEKAKSIEIGPPCQVLLIWKVSHVGITRSGPELLIVVSETLIFCSCRALTRIFVARSAPPPDGEFVTNITRIS